MVKFLDTLPDVFRERYLKTHNIYLKSVADILAHQYKGNDLQQTCTKMLIQLQKTNKMKQRTDIGGETIHFRNLRNCWYHECALHFPKSSNQRLLFAAWKIIQCYYVVFASIASIVCCYYPPKKSHDATLNIYAQDFLCNKERKFYFLIPINFYLNQQGKFSKKFYDAVDWDYANTYHIPNIIRCLQSVRKKNRIACIPHYLKSLRDWVTYGDAYLFIRLYGTSIKEDLDFSLSNISFAHCVQTEFFLLRLFGWNAVNLQFKTFLEQIKVNIGITSEQLISRFEVYSRSKSLFQE